MATGGINSSLLNFDLSRIQGDFVIVAALWHSDIVDNLVQGARETLLSEGVLEKNIRLVRVPGAFEIPLMCSKVLASSDVESVIALGVIIRGDTPHFDYVAAACANGIAEVSLRTNVPISFGVLTLDSYDQAAERSCVGPGNKGAEAALTSLEMACSLKQIG